MDWRQWITAAAASLSAFVSHIDWQAVGAVFAFLSAVGALIAAWATKQAAVATKQTVLATKRAAQSQVLLQFLRSYASPEMSRALRTLRWWHTKHGEQFAADWAQGWERGDAVAKYVDSSRRMVTSYFQDVDALRRAHLISQGTMRVAVDKEGVAVLVNVCGPLEAALRSTADLTFIDRVVALVPHRRELQTYLPMGSPIDEWERQ